MGLFNWKHQKIDFSKMFEEQMKREASYMQKSSAELSKLSDDELCNAVWVRTENIVLSKEDLMEGFNSLNEKQRIFYAVYYLEMEVQNGGLCQFFINASRMVAPIVSGCIGMIGATAHRELYDTFIKKHQIDLHDLSSFDCETVEAFQSQYARYPFEECDDKFYELEPLQSYLIPFVKKYMEEF